MPRKTANLEAVTTIGIDKNTFPLIGSDKKGAIVKNGSKRCSWTTTVVRTLKSAARKKTPASRMLGL